MPTIGDVGFSDGSEGAPMSGGVGVAARVHALTGASQPISCGCFSSHQRLTGGRGATSTIVVRHENSPGTACPAPPSFGVSCPLVIQALCTPMRSEERRVGK